jgi:hypothetical protein
MKKILLNFCIGTITCICLMLSSSVNSFNSVEAIAMRTAMQHQNEAEIALQTQINSPSEPNKNLIAQADVRPTRYVAILLGKDVVPSSVSTSANGAVGAVLIENRLVVRGSFGNLSSGLRDYAADPASPPNPNISSGVHVHRGTISENGPFQYALQVEPNRDGLGGSLKGEYTLTAEQLQALNSGNLYIDLHTKNNRAGELRGVLRVDR